MSHTRTSLRVFTAVLSTLLLGVVFTVLPFSSPAHALNGVSTISVDSVTVNEGVANGSITFHVTVAPAPSFPTDNISADIKPVEGTARQGADYNNFTAHVSWAPGDNAVKTVTVNNVINEDNIREPNETFGLSIVNPQSASAGQAGQVTINDNEGGTIPTIHITQPAAAPEGNANNDRHVQVTLSPASTGTVTINYATSDDTATSDSAKGDPDYTPITTKQLTWAAGNTDPKDIPITIKGDTTPEPDEQFFLNFGSPNNAAISGDNPAVITLTNDDGTAADVPKLTLENIPDKLEGDSSTTTQTITVTLAPAATQTVTVNYATSDGTAVGGQLASGKCPDAVDYLTTKGALVFGQGVTSKTFTVPVCGDAIDENDEIYHVTLSGAANATIADPPTKDAKILNDDYGQITTGAGRGGGPHVRQFGATGSDLGGWMTFSTGPGAPPYAAGIHVARGDFFKADGTVGEDGVDEIVVASGPGYTPKVLIYATDGTLRANFLAYDQNFSGGLYVAAGNFDGDTSNGDEIVTGAGPGGGPHVKVFRVKGPGDNVELLNSFFAYDPHFTGGVRVAAGNETGDSKDEIVTAPGAGGGPHVRVFSTNSDGSVTPGAGFMAYDPHFTGGVWVAAAAGRIVTGAGPGGGPHVRVFDGNGVAQGGGFFAYDPSFTGGVSVGVGNLDNDLAPEIVTGAGPGGGPHVKVFHLDGSMPFGGGFFAYDPNFHGGVEVAVSVAGTP